MHQSDFSRCCAVRIYQKDSAREAPVRPVLGLRMLTAVNIRFGGEDGGKKAQESHNPVCQPLSLLLWQGGRMLWLHCVAAVLAS